MEKKQAEKRIKELRKIVEYHAKKYYDEDKPEISDFEYDMMMLELRSLESQFPEFICSAFVQLYKEASSSDMAPIYVLSLLTPPQAWKFSRKL